MTPNYRLITGNCLDKLKLIPSNSIDSIVTDPPYFLINSAGAGDGFMNKEWDGTKNLWQYLWKNQKFVQPVINILQSLQVEKNGEEALLAQENVNISIYPLDVEKKENVIIANQGFSLQNLLNESSVVLIAVTKGMLVELTEKHGAIKELLKLEQSQSPLHK